MALSTPTQEMRFLPDAVLSPHAHNKLTLNLSLMITISSRSPRKANRRLRCDRASLSRLRSPQGLLLFFARRRVR